jgi:hypothetical protein
MGHVLCSGKRLPALIAVATAFLAFGADQALAVRTAAGAAPITRATDPVNWTGTVEGSAGGPSDCDGLFSTNLCSSFFLAPGENGRIEVVVDPAVPTVDEVLAVDLNLFVFDCGPVELRPLVGGPANPQTGCDLPVLLSGSSDAPGQNNVGESERVTFVATAGTAYEVLTVPAVTFAPAPYNGCAAYDDASDPTDGVCVDPAPTEAPGPVPATQFLQDCAPAGAGSGSTGSRHVTGGGYFRRPNDKKQHFSTHVNRKDSKLKGVLNFNDEVTNSRYSSKRITCAFFNDADKSVVYRGTATKKTKGSDGKQQEVGYCFSARARDGGKEGGPVDEFEVSFFRFNAANETCDTSAAGTETFGGPLDKGQVTYHLQGDDERCRDD